MALPPHLANLESWLSGRVDEALGEYRRAVEKRLRDAVEQLSATSRELPEPALPSLLDGLELGTLDLGSRRDGAREALGTLLAAHRDFDRAMSQGEVLDALLTRALAWADRAALLLIRDEELIGWGERGFGTNGFCGRPLTQRSDVRGQLIPTRGCRELDAQGAAELAGELDVEAAGAAVIVPLVLRDQVAALLWADRREGAPETAALQLLVSLAAQRLELQGITAREQTPTLYSEAEAAGAALPLWSSSTAVSEEPEAAEEPSVAFEVTDSEPELADSSTAEPAIEAEHPPAGPESPDEIFAPFDAPPAEFEQELADAEVAVEPSEQAASAPVELVPDVAETLEPVSEAVEADLEASAEAWEPIADEEPAATEALPIPAAVAADEAEVAPGEAIETPAAAAIEGDLAEVESLPEFDEEPEPEITEAPAEAVPGPAAGEADQLGTVRMAIPPVAPAPEAPPIAEEVTAPHAIEQASRPAGIHEVAVPTAAPPVSSLPTVDDIDPTEDATVLTAPPVPPPPPPVAPPPVREEDPMDRTASRGGRSTLVAPPPDLDGPGLAFVTSRVHRPPADSPVHEEAKRLARLLISEIKLYNEEQVLEGRRNRDLYHRLRDDIDRSRQIFDERVDTAVRAEVDYFQLELVRSLAGGDPRALGI